MYALRFAISYTYKDGFPIVTFSDRFLDEDSTDIDMEVKPLYGNDKDMLVMIENAPLFIVY